jgi:PIN domain nuclease of toxin-antitoxin system
MDYVTDTHSLVWYFTDDVRLGSNALEAFQSSEEEGTIFIPAVVLAEIMFIAKKGKITISFHETLGRVEENENFVVVPLDADILKIAYEIEADLEMHDKLIVATAVSRRAILITKDENVSRSRVVETLW